MVERTNRNGLLDWLVQRFTAVIIGIYVVFLLLYFVDHPNLIYLDWHDLFSNTWMRIATFVVLISILWHAWIGLWTILTDYVKHKPLRLLLEFFIILLLLSYFIWTLEILWVK